jgi:hypothetical protein
LEYIIIYLLGVIVVMSFMKYGDMVVSSKGGRPFDTPLFIIIGCFSWVSAFAFVVLFFFTEIDENLKKM